VEISLSKIERAKALGSLLKETQWQNPSMSSKVEFTLAPSIC